MLVLHEMCIMYCMSSRIVVCGRFGSELSHTVDCHPRFGITGKLSTPIMDKAFRLGGDGYRIAFGLRELSSSVYAVGAIGDDDLGMQVHASLEKASIHCDCLVQKEGLATAQVLHMVDKDGITNSYIYDLLPTEEESEPVLGPLKLLDDMNYTILTSANSSVRRALFEALEDTKSPLLWHVQSQVCDLDPDQLLRYIHRSQYLVMSPQEQHYFCNTLGLASIDLLLKEGPRAIIVIEYEPSQCSYVYNVFTSERLENQQFASITGYDVSRYRDMILGFVIGFVYAAYEVADELEIMLRLGIACSEEYMVHLDKSDHPLRYKNIAQRLAVRHS